MWGPLLALVVVAGACGGSKPRASAPPTFVVLEAGAEPRRPLRYQPVAGAAPERIEVQIKLRGSFATTNTVFEHRRTDADAPTIRLVGRLEAMGTATTGEAQIAYEVEAGSVLGDFVDPEMHRLVVTEVLALRGLRGTWRRSATGVISKVVLDAAKVSRADGAGLTGVADAILQSFVRFPDAAVGAGAMWRSEYDERYGGIAWRTTMTSRVKELSETHVTIEVTTAMRARSQALSVEPNRTLRLTSGERTVDRVLTVPLDRLAARGDLRDTAEIDVQIVDGRARVTSTLRVERIATFAPAAD